MTEGADRVLDLLRRARKMGCTLNIEQISERTGLSRNYLSTVLKKLEDRGLATSDVRGPQRFRAEWRAVF